MSQRHFRKLQQSLQPTLDDEEDEEVSVQETTWTKPSGSKKKKHKKPSETPVDLDIGVERSVVQKSGSNEDQPTQIKQPERDAAITPSAEGQGKVKKAKKVEARKRRQEKELEEDRLLNERTADIAETNGLGGGHQSSGGVQTLASTVRGLVQVLSCCDVSQLNARTERIRSFGIESVEDIGDGHRRSTTAGAAAGGATANGLLPMRPPGFALPKFRDGLFVSPNRHCWPVFSTLGVALRETRSERRGGNEAAGSTRRRVFSVDWSDKEFTDAQRNFEAAVAAMANVNEMMERCFAKYPYHIPTLLQLHQSFGIMGDAPNSQLMLDMALYAVGVLLGRFPLKDSVADRVLPFSDGNNRLVFETIKSGVQLALKRGCNRTAFSLHRLLLSLDDTDPCGALLSWDYLAIRAREWAALLSAQSLMETSWALEFAEQSASVECAAGGVAAANDAVESALTSLVRAARALPGFHFNAALAKFLTEEAEEQRQIAATKGGAAAPSRKPTSTEQGSCPDARTMLAKALLRFPSVAWKLVEKIELDVNTTTDAGWSQLAELKRDGGRASAAVADHIGMLFVERSGELFKTKEASRLLLTAAARTVATGSAGCTTSTLDMFELRLQRDTFAAEPSLRRYRATSLDDVIGERVTRIPQELLNPGANPDEVQRDARQHEIEHLLAQGYPQTELDALDRFAAVFGPLPVEVPLDQRFAMYDEMLEEYRQRIGNETNPVALFLQTLLPWNNLRDMALARAMEERGVDDPVRHRLAQQQLRNQRVWRDAEAAAQAAEDDASSSEDDAW